jgi:activating signal cointegrator 1
MAGRAGGILRREQLLRRKPEVLPMKCISLWQPWASAIPLLLKRIETRDWSTKVRGRIGIHAAKRWTGAEQRFATARRRAGDPLPDPMPLGAIVCTVDLWDVLPSEMLVARGLSDLEQMYGNYAPGRFGWLTRDVFALPEPIPYVGKQGFFNVPDELFPGEALKPARTPQASLLNPAAAWPFPVAHKEGLMT